MFGVSELSQLLACAAAVFLGVTGWSFSEYAIHHWAGHDRRWLRNPFGVEHQAHHGRGNYFASWWKKFGAAAAVVAVLWIPATAIAGTLLGALFIAGFVGFYLYYEALHWMEHVWESTTRYGRWARRHHFFHHFHDPSRNHGVTSPVWDHVFGTNVEPDVIRVPEKLAPFWLVNPDTGDVWTHLQGEWELRRSRRSKSVPKAA